MFVMFVILTASNKRTISTTRTGLIQMKYPTIVQLIKDYLRLSGDQMMRRLARMDSAQEAATSRIPKLNAMSLWLASFRR
jgi:hypothetical protein